MGVQYDGQIARLPRAEAGLTQFVAEDETPRPIEMEDRRFLRTGREAQLGSLGAPGFRGDGEVKRLFLPELDPILVVAIRARHDLEDVEPLDLRTTRENRLFPCLPTIPLEVAPHLHLRVLAVAVDFLGGDPLAGVGEVAVTVAVQVENVLVEDHPDARLSLRPEDQKAVLGMFRFVGWFLAQGAINLRQIDSPGLTGEGQADHHREEAEPMHRHLCPEAELVILSRKQIDNDGPRWACQSANFQMTQLVRAISAARTA